MALDMTKEREALRQAFQHANEARDASSMMHHDNEANEMVDALQAGLGALCQCVEGILDFVVEQSGKIDTD